MTKDDFAGKSANEILLNPPFDDASWHFYQARSWLDLAKRTKHPSCIHYAAIEMRYGIEYILFELLVMSAALSEKEYNECLRNPKAMKKKLRHNNNYEKLVRFTKATLQSSPSPPLKIHFWKLDELFECWGTASEYLHFVGAQPLTYYNPEWVKQALERLGDELEWLWIPITTTTGIGILPPANMLPRVHKIWDKFLTEDMSDEKLVQALIESRSL